MPQYDDVFIDTPAPDTASPSGSPPSRGQPTARPGKHIRVQSVGVRGGGKGSEWLSPQSGGGRGGGGHNRSVSAAGGSGSYSKPTFSSAHREHSIARRKQLMFGHTVPAGASDGFAEHKSPTIDEEEGDASFFS